MTPRHSVPRSAWAHGIGKEDRSFFCSTSKSIHKDQGLGTIRGGHESSVFVHGLVVDKIKRIDKKEVKTCTTSGLLLFGVVSQDFYRRRFSVIAYGNVWVVFGGHDWWVEMKLDG